MHLIVIAKRDIRLIGAIIIREARNAVKIAIVIKITAVIWLNGSPITLISL